MFEKLINNKEGIIDNVTEKCKQLINSPMKKSLVIAMLLSGGANVEAKDLKTNLSNKNRPGLNLPDNFNADSTNSNTFSIDSHQRLFMENEKGENRFSPWGLIAPLQVDVEQYKKIEKKLTIDIPYHYARQFNSAKLVNEEARVKLENYIKRQIQAQLADSYTALDPSNIAEQAYFSDNVDNQQTIYDVEGIYLNGFASPEGPELKGEQTINKGEVDVENIDLGRLRAENIEPTLLKVLQAEGIDINESDLQKIEISGNEIQLTDLERQQVIALGKKLQVGGFNDEEIIFNTFVKYNDGTINDIEANTSLQRIISEKRKVKVEVVLKGGKKNVYSLPVPLLLLLPLLAFRRRRNEAVAEEVDSVAEPVIPKQLPEYKRDDVVSAAETLVNETMIRQTITEDLFNNIDNPVTIANGIDYRQIANEVKTYKDAYGQKELEDKVTKIILKQWQAHDVKVRQQAGLTIEESQIGLDYEQQPEQVAWAICHAREIIGLANAQLAASSDDRAFDKEFVRRYNQVTQKII